MGLYTVPCRQCGTLFLWFSGNSDQRCSHCRYNGNNNVDRPGPEQRADTGGVSCTCPMCAYHRAPQNFAMVVPNVAPQAAGNGPERSFMLTVCTRCGRGKKYSGPVLGTEPCNCDNYNAWGKDPWLDGS